MRRELLWTATCFSIGACIAVAAACTAQEGSTMEPTFGDDVALLKAHTNVIVLSSGDARVAVAPAFQGRVMTSSADGDQGPGFGWINRDFIAAGKTVPHINVYGGEDRFWMGPEGGQFSLFFAPGAFFDPQNWQTPPLIDTEPFDVVSKSSDAVAFRKLAKITNYAKTRFEIQIDRRVQLLPRERAPQLLNVQPAAGTRIVAYESVNEITNKSQRPWKKETGLLSIWILGMYKPSPQSTIVIPFQEGSEAELGPKVIDDYFGKVPADRLVVKENVLFFSGDGHKRSKIGITPRRARPVMGSYDAQGGVLTIVQYEKPAAAADYVNSKWEIQKEPFHGDVANSYNDGPPAPGKPPLGPFYELESSSPAVELAPNESVKHWHQTIHIRGTEAELDPIAKAVLGVSIAEIKSAMPK